MENAKKIPVSVSFGEVKVSRKEFLVPCPLEKVKLIGIESGKEYRYGTISYTGVSVSVEAIIGKMNRNGIHISDTLLYKEKLEYYIDQIYNYKVGNIVTIEPNVDNDNFVLTKVANR